MTTSNYYSLRQYIDKRFILTSSKASPSLPKTARSMNPSIVVLATGDTFIVTREEAAKRLREMRLA